MNICGSKAVKNSDLSSMFFLQQKYTTVLLLLLLSTALCAQNSQVRFEHITSQDGLSENVVNSIFQDSKGFMWFSTNDGLNRYDGYNFTTFKPSPDHEFAINSNLPFDMAEDQNGKIWIGTTGAGLSVFDPATENFTAYRHDPNNPQSLSNDQIMAMTCDQSGRIWIGTRSGLNLLLPHENVAEPIQILRLTIADRLESNIVHAIAEDKSGNIWLGTRLGLYRCIVGDQKGDFEFEYITVDRNPYPPQVRSLQIDNNGRLVVGTIAGLFYQTKQGNDIAFESISDIPNQQAITVDDQGKIWTGTYQGLLCFEAEDRTSLPQLDATFTIEEENPNSLNKNVIKSLFKDKTGIIWVGTNGGGLNRFDPARKPFFHFGQNLRSNGNRYKAIRSLLEDSYGNLWVGTEGGGLFWQSASGHNKNYDQFQSLGATASVFALAEVTENGQQFVYVGSEDQPSLQKIRITPSGPKEVSSVQGHTGSVFTLLQSRDSSLWVGTYNQGLSRWVPKDDGSFDLTFFRNTDNANKGLLSNIIRKVYEDRKGNIWIGTAEGLNLIEAKETQKAEPEILRFQNMKDDPRSLSHNYILDIYESGSGLLWIGTFGGGLNKLTFDAGYKDVSFTRYLESDGLSNNAVKGILEDVEGNIWLATNGGLSKFSNETESFQNYNINDGLQDNEFLEGASTIRANGELLFGGVNGFNSFHPENIGADRAIPEVVLTKLSVNNKEVKPGEKIHGRVILSKSISLSQDISLKYSQNDFSIEFAALHFSAPRQNRYAFKLEGYHKDWIEVGSDKRDATFTNLPYGDYTLYVKASNGDNLWTPRATQLKIVIQPPFWLTWYAYAFYALLLIVALWLFRRYTVISIHEKHRLMLDQMEREKLEELNQIKLRFFTNISHELRTPLSLIIAPLEYILEKGKAISSEKLQQQYHYMYKNSMYLMRLVNQLLDFRKLDQGSLNLRVGKADIISFIRETTEPFQFIASKKNINFSVGHADQTIYTFFDPDVLEKVLYNLLSNAFKFTPEEGKISVEVAEKELQIPGKNKRKTTAQFIEIKVSDSGSGISKKKLKKVFERFYKEGEKKENKDGAGIGLAHTKSLIELHHGTIEVKSGKGEGAHFIVNLPKEDRSYLKSEIDQKQIDGFKATSDPLEYLVTDPISEVDISGIGMDFEEREEKLPLLLFVDDNSDIRRFIKEGFENDFRIIEAEDGEKAYEIAISSLPDIIVSDVMMPNMSGIELCEILKTNSLTSHIPIVLLTAKSTADDQLLGLQTGADAYISKPFKIDILRTQLLNIYLQRERLKQRFRQEVILQPEEITVTSADEEFLKRAMTIVEEHMSDSDFNVEALVKDMFISRSKLYLKLKALTGQSSSEFIRTIRLKRAIQLLEGSDYTIKEIMFMTGFNTASYFSKCFKTQFGVVPSEYLKQKKKVERVL